MRLELRTSQAIVLIDMGRHMAAEVGDALRWRTLYPVMDLPLAEDGSVRQRRDGAVEVIRSSLREFSEAGDPVGIDVRLSLPGALNDLVEGLDAALELVGDLAIVEPDPPRLKLRVRVGVGPEVPGAYTWYDIPAEQGPSVSAPNEHHSAGGAPPNGAVVLETCSVEIGRKDDAHIALVPAEEDKLEAGGDELWSASAEDAPLTDRQRVDLDASSRIQHELGHGLSVGGVASPTVGRPVDSGNAGVGGDAPSLSRGSS